MFKFHQITLILATAMVIPNAHGAGSREDMACAGGALLLAGGAKWLVDKAGNSTLVKDASHITGLSAHDLGNVAALSGGAISLAFIANDDTRAGLQRMAKRAPVSATVAAVTCTKTFQEIAGYVPVIGPCVTCEDKECPGICTKCKCTKMTIAIGLYLIVDTLIGSYWKGATPEGVNNAAVRGYSNHS